MDEQLYLRKLRGCWFGKAVGGTLGQPYEGLSGPLRLTFYDPVPTDMVPNDDIDLQVLWACLLDRMETPVVDRQTLADGWLANVNFPWDEYGMAIRNLRRGIRPPHSGRYDNFFIDGLGAAIRSELWASLAPGNPELAAKFAYEDACVDHDGDGLWAEIYLAALESMAFLESDLDSLDTSALHYIPATSVLHRALTDTCNWCARSEDPAVIRRQIMETYYCENFTSVVMNLPFIVAGLLLGKGDFSRSICLAANMGQDTDCTAASVGAILGLRNPNAIGAEWLKPIGNKLVLNDGIVGITPPATLDDFCAMINRLRKRIRLRDAASAAPEPEWPKLANKVEIAVVNLGNKKNGLTPHYQPMEFPGLWCRYPATGLTPDYQVIVRRQFKIRRSDNYRLMVNSSAISRVYLNDEFIFGRDGGAMVPSFHRAPLNQWLDRKLLPGEYELKIVLSPLAGMEELEWVMGIGDVATKQWLTDAFD